jgi:P2 family phage contractile tail tube protein
MSIRRLSNCRIYVEGIEATGVLESIELPEIEFTQMEYKSLGTVGTLELPSNDIEAMTCTMVWLHQPPEFSSLMNNPTLTSQVQVRADQSTYDATGLPVPGSYLIIMRLRPKMITVGTFEKGEGTKPENEFAVDYILCEIDGEQLYEIDARNPNGIRVNGALINTVGN